MVEVALEYVNKHHFSVIPVGRNKKPLLDWEEYQSRFATEEEIRTWFTKWKDANIGIVTGIISNLAVIDIDTEEGKEAIQEYIPDSIITPTVSTPRGGQHLYFRCPNKSIRNNTKIVKGCDLRANGGYVVAPPSINGNGKQYSWVVSLDADISSLSKEYLHYINNISSSYIESVTNPKYQTVTKCYKMFHLGTRDNDLFHAANCLIKGGMKDENAIQVLEILARNCEPAFPLKEATEKILSALKRVERRERNISQEIKDWISVTNSDFRVTELCNELQCVTKEQKGAVRTAISRLVKEGFIQKTKHLGCYRIVNTQLEKIDYLSVKNQTLDIQWPFGIEGFVKTMPKNIIIVAGVSNAGKTAFLLNFVEMNMDKHEIHYFSSEMGDMELQTRLSKFDRPIDSWRFKPYERVGEYADVIQPDAINIIDFLEIYQEHYLIGQWIKDIYDKLGKGIAIIAIQKKPGSAYGVGGATTMEKARLYISIDNGKLKIEKGKNWADPLVNPNYMAVNFKLVGGSKFMQTDDWYKEEPK